MAKLQRQVGTTSQVVDILALNSSVTTGAGLTGLAYNTASLTCYYHRNTASADVAVTLATMTLGTWATGGFIVVDGTNMPGLYQFGIPNAALASGADSVVIYFQGATNLAPIVLEIELTATSNQDAVHGGMSALPNTACTTNASLLTSGTGTAQLTTSSGAVLLQATQTGVTIPTVTTVTNQLTAAAIATGVWQDSTSGDFTTASSIGKSLYTSGVVPGGTNGLFIAGTNAATSITTGLTAHLIGTVDTVTTVTNQLTAAAIATGVWQDATAGDFTTSSSIGKSLYNSFTAGTSVFTTAALANAPTGGSAPTAAQIATAVWEDTTAGGDFGTSGSIGKLIATTGLTVLAVTDGVTVTTNNDKTGYSLTTAPPTAAAVATAVWQDSTAGDFTASSSIGKSLYNAFTAGTSVYTTAALANAPTGGSAPTAAQIATAVWSDTTSGDFTTTSSPGKILVTQLGGAFTTSSSSVYSTASLANAPTGGSADRGPDRHGGLAGRDRKRLYNGFLDRQEPVQRVHIEHVGLHDRGSCERPNGRECPDNGPDRHGGLAGRDRKRLYNGFLDRQEPVQRVHIEHVDLHDRGSCERPNGRECPDNGPDRHGGLGRHLGRRRLWHGRLDRSPVEDRSPERLAGGGQRCFHRRIERGDDREHHRQPLRLGRLRDGGRQRQSGRDPERRSRARRDRRYVAHA